MASRSSPFDTINHSSTQVLEPRTNQTQSNRFHDLQILRIKQNIMENVRPPPALRYRRQF